MMEHGETRIRDPRLWKLSWRESPNSNAKTGNYCG